MTSGARMEKAWRKPVLGAAASAKWRVQTGELGQEWDNRFMGFLDRLRRTKPTPPVAPQFDDAVARRLADAGKSPETVQAVPAEPLEIPKKPDLPGFQGTVRLELTLDEKGVVRAVSMDGALPAHVGELEAWAHTWRFRPASMEGQAHPCRMVFEVPYA